ncbi:MAG: serine/threonine protein kinase [Acidobacteriia bacterium]|nr:serine/threonine protein kinase [Terriglobia bacterium]
MAQQTPRQFKTAFETYEFVQQVGAGGTGAVFEVTASDGEHYALKVLDKTKATREKRKRFENEIHFCSTERHRNIIHVLGSGITEDESPFYVMPLYPSTLHKVMAAGIKPADVLPVFDQLLSGLEAAHLMGVCHRDLKPQNILHDPKSNTYVLADFGIARFGEADLHTLVETGKHERLANFMYAAPEQRVPGRVVGQPADIYAAGLILNEMFTAEIPQGAGFKPVGAVAPDFAYLDGLVDAMRQQVPERRPTVAAVKEELIARGNEFISQQKLDALKKQVVPETDIDDPLVRNPITLIAPEDYDKDQLVLKLSGAPNPQWIRLFQNPSGGYTFIDGMVQPNLFAFHGIRAVIRIADERYTQRAVDYFKQYLQQANTAYAAWAQEQHRQETDAKRRELARRVAEEEKRQRVLSTLRV